LAPRAAEERDPAAAGATRTANTAAVARMRLIP
jgi:hypothetical protein